MLRHRSLPLCSHSLSSPRTRLLRDGTSLLRICIVGSLNTLLDDFPEELDVEAAGDANAFLTRRQQPHDGASSLRSPFSSVIERTLRDDADLESLAPRRPFGARGVKVVERDLVARACQDGCYGERVVKWRSADYAEDVAAIGLHSVSYACMNGLVVVLG